MMTTQSVQLPEAEARRVPQRTSLLMTCDLTDAVDSQLTFGSVFHALRPCRPDLACLQLGGRTLRSDPHGPVIEDVSQATDYLRKGGALLTLGPSDSAASAASLPALAVEGNAAVAPIQVVRPSASGGGGLHVAMPVSPRAFARFAGEDQVELLRWHGRALAVRSRADAESQGRACGESLADPEDPAALEAEVERLPPEQTLLQTGDHVVFWARAPQIPRVLREVGRLRELTFRAAGEGTGRAVDLDVYDSTYTHLFVWERVDRQIAGAYRIGATDEVLKTRAGPYTATLFRFADSFFERLGDALELGRSFVRPERQRSSRTLLLLWKGIGAFVAKRPRYRRLFGPVSVSADYQRFSRELMVSVLEAECYRHPLAAFVRARTPVVRRTFGDGGLGDPARILTSPADLSAVIANAEVDGKGLPVLLSEYIKLGGKFLDFNLDPAFSEVIDGLVVVDLERTSQRLLRFYMGQGPATRFLDGAPR